MAVAGRCCHCSEIKAAPERSGAAFFLPLPLLTTRLPSPAPCCCLKKRLLYQHYSIFSCMSNMPDDRPLAAFAIRTLDGVIRVGLLALLLLTGLRSTPVQAQAVDLDTTFEQYKVTLDRDSHRVTRDAPDPICGPDAQTNPLCGLEEFYRCLMTPADTGCGRVSFIFRQQAAGGSSAPEDFTWQLRAVEFALRAFEQPNLNLVLIEVQERLCWGDQSVWLWQPDGRLAHYILWWTKNQRLHSALASHAQSR